MMKSDSRITVCIPSRNAAKTVGMAVRSALLGLGESDRVLVFIDGEDRDSESVLSKISDRRLRVLSSKEQVGRVAAANALLSLVDTPFFARLDADDLCLPWRFSFARWRICGRQDNFLFTSSIKFGNRKLPSWSAPVGLGPDVLALYLVFGNVLTHSTLVARTSTLRALGGYRDLEVADDYDLILRAAIAGEKIRHFALPTVMYRRSSSQISSSTDYMARVLANREIAELKLKLAKKQSLMSSESQKAEMAKLARKLSKGKHSDFDLGLREFALLKKLLRYLSRF
jgi:glycosyltransferase involved in cell wall biosynthesis